MSHTQLVTTVRNLSINGTSTGGTDQERGRWPRTSDTTHPLLHLIHWDSESSVHSTNVPSLLQEKNITILSGLWLLAVPARTNDLSRLPLRSPLCLREHGKRERRDVFYIPLTTYFHPGLSMLATKALASLPTVISSHELRANLTVWARSCHRAVITVIDHGHLSAVPTCTCIQIPGRTSVSYYLFPIHFLNDDDVNLNSLGKDLVPPFHNLKFKWMCVSTYHTFACVERA